MLSDRARRFLGHHERRPHVEDLGMVRAALERQGVPVTDALLDFHRTFAGLVERNGPEGKADEFVFGLIHEDPKWLDPMEVSVIEGDDPPGNWYVICADGHPSYDLRIDQAGVYYTTCIVPRASSFFMQTEQDAFVWEFASKHPGRGYPLWLWNDPNEMIDILPARLKSRLVPDISDQYGSIYATDEMILTYKVNSKEFSAYIVNGAEPPELDGFRFQFKEKKKSLARLQQELTSPYSGRRYHAICELRETTDPKAAPLFLSVVNDGNHHIRIMAIQGLGRVRSIEAIPELHRLIREDEDDMIVLNAVMALRKIETPATLSALIEATQHRQAFIRRDAAIALGQSGDKSVIPALKKLLKDNDGPDKYTGLCPTRETRSVAEHSQEAINNITARAAGG